MPENKISAHLPREAVAMLVAATKTGDASRPLAKVVAVECAAMEVRARWPQYFATEQKK